MRSSSFGAWPRTHPARLVSRFAIALLLSFASAAPAYADAAMEWVQRMSDAMRDLSYQGTFVYLHDNRLEAMQISHLRDAQGEKERLVSLNGEAREVIRDNHNLTCIWPSSRKVIVDVSRKNSFSPIFIPEDIERLEKYYDMKLVGRDRVAAMEAVIVHIDPRDEYRYGMKFWINEANGLMMKSRLFDEQGEVIEEVLFTNLTVFDAENLPQIDTMPRIDDNFTLVRYHSGDNAIAFAADNAWQVSGIPGGSGGNRYCAERFRTAIVSSSRWYIPTGSRHCRYSSSASRS